MSTLKLSLQSRAQSGICSVTGRSWQSSHVTASDSPLLICLQNPSGWVGSVPLTPNRSAPPCRFTSRQALEELARVCEVGPSPEHAPRPDLLPPDYIVELSKLQDEVPPAGPD